MSSRESSLRRPLLVGILTFVFAYLALNVLANLNFIPYFMDGTGRSQARAESIARGIPIVDIPDLIFIQSPKAAFTIDMRSIVSETRSENKRPTERPLYTIDNQSLAEAVETENSDDGTTYSIEHTIDTHLVTPGRALGVIVSDTLAFTLGKSIAGLGNRVARAQADISARTVTMNTSVPSSLSLADVPLLGSLVVPTGEGSVVALERASTIEPSSMEPVLPVLEYPTTISISSIGLVAPIENPLKTSITVLDDALTRAVVRYPGSALLGGEGAVVLFGHSSHLPVVRNKMFKIFNGLPELTLGDEIEVRSETRVVVYRVTEVRKTDANEEVLDLDTKGRELILATCDTFGAKSSRWLIRAEFVGEKSL